MPCRSLSIRTPANPAHSRPVAGPCEQMSSNNRSSRRRVSSPAAWREPSARAAACHRMFRTHRAIRLRGSRADRRCRRPGIHDRRSRGNDGCPSAVCFLTSRCAVQPYSASRVVANMLSCMLAAGIEPQEFIGEIEISLANRGFVFGRIRGRLRCEDPQRADFAAVEAGEQRHGRLFAFVEDIDKLARQHMSVDRCPMARTQPPAQPLLM